MSEFKPLTQAIIDGKVAEVVKLVQEALDDGMGAQAILSDLMIPGMNHVGELMAEEEYFIPDVLLSAKAMRAGVELLEPLLAAEESQTLGHVILGTVEADIHDIGKNMVAMLLKGSGFSVQDLGISVTSDKFLEAVASSEGTVILGMSALITPVLDEMPKTIQAIEKAGLRDRVKIIVGGAPITEEFAKEIGADGAAKDAASAVTLSKKLLA